MDGIVQTQRRTCRAFGARWVEASENGTVHLARDMPDGVQRLNGLRLGPKGDDTGWVIWADHTFPETPAFETVTVAALAGRCPSVVSLLGLPPGWEFRIDGLGLDAWENASLLGP